MKRAPAVHLFSFLAITLICMTIPGETQAESRRFDFDSSVGVVLVASNDEICMQIKNPHLKEGSRVKLVPLSRPQAIWEATVSKKLSGICSDPGFQDGFDYYSLRLIKRQVKMIEIALGVVNPLKGMSLKKGLVSIDLDRDGQREYFRDCTSSEGVHLTIWSGQPLKGKRRWHYYYYLRYDVVPSCQKKDYMD